jgi:hypothetical protein
MTPKELAKKTIELMDLIEKDLYKFITGNAMAGRRARVKLIELEKVGKEFRKKSTKE